MSRIWVTPDGMPRCIKCCQHGVSLSAYWCGWCDDLREGMDDCYVASDEPQWMCPHGIGTPYGQDYLGLHRDDFLACLREAKP